MLNIVIFIACLLIPALANAAIVWTDDLEPGSVLSNNTFLTGTLIPQGSYALDTTIKHGGTRSLRLNFPQNCQNTINGTEYVPNGQCGGSLSRQYTTPLSNVYNRAWVRFSGDTNQGATIGSAGGTFKTYDYAFTKLFEDVGSGDSSQGPPRTWLVFGGSGAKGARSRNISFHIENVPSKGATTVLNTSVSFQDNVWYCVETHKQMNTFGSANGIAELWINDVLVAASNTVSFRNQSIYSAANWTEFEMFRQGGFGNIWWDDIAIDNSQRIGCGGTLPPQDTTPPTPPTSLTAQ